jgi:hypothetical protein
LSGTADLGTNMTAIKSATAFRQGRYSEAAATLVSTMDQTDPDWAKAAQVVNLVYAALADSTQRDKALAARARLYPRECASVQARSLGAGMACSVCSAGYVRFGGVGCRLRSSQSVRGSRGKP